MEAINRFNNLTEACQFISDRAGDLGKRTVTVVDNAIKKSGNSKLISLSEKVKTHVKDNLNSYLAAATILNVYLSPTFFIPITFAAGILIGVNSNTNLENSDLKTNFLLFTAASLVVFNPIGHIFTIVSGVSAGNYLRNFKS